MTLRVLKNLTPFLLIFKTGMNVDLDALSKKVQEAGFSVASLVVTMKVELGFNYQLETSKDLLLWEKVGEEFVAKDENLFQEFNIEAVGKFFRLTRVP